MPLLTSAQIMINTRTLRIGGQTYSLGNLARVQIVKLAKPPQAEKGNFILAGLVGFFSFVIITAIGASTGIGLMSNLGWLLAIGLGMIVYQRTKESYVPRYALMLESTGKPRTALISTDKNVLEYASKPIIDAMENPPTTEQIYTINNVISGDQYNLTGDHNIGKLESDD